MSSDAVNRTSTGMETLPGRRSIRRRRPANASGNASRGKPAARLAVVVHAVIGLGQCPFGVRHPVELEMVVVGDPALQTGQDIVDGSWPLVRVQDERFHAAQR